MATDEDALNDALNTPTDELDNEPDLDYDPDADPDVDPDADSDADPDVDPDADPEVASLLDADPPRRENRVQRLANERRESVERAERAEREAADLRARLQSQETDAARRAAEERQRILDEMDPNERRLMLAEQEARMARFEAADNRDATAFAAVVNQHPQLKGLAAEVETELAKARAAGQNPNRQQVAQFLLGQRALKNLIEGPKKAKAAKQRVDAARGRPMRAASDVSRNEPERRGMSDSEKRLQGVKL